MSPKPIFVATHPRACSTAFERVFMTRRDILSCVHEPFGDAFYFGPERLSDRYESDEDAREKSGFSESTFKNIFERIDRESQEGKRLFIKDITHYLVPPNGKTATIAPSLVTKPRKGVGTNGTNGETNGEVNVIDNGVHNGVHSDAKSNGVNGTNGHHAPYPYPTAGEPGNPTVVPSSILSQFHFTFLIRHPRHSIPSYFRCTIPPLDNVTGFYNFMPSEAGYDELRRVFDFLKEKKMVGPAIAGPHETGGNGEANGSNGTKEGEVSITVIDADDLLDDPEGIVSSYCKEVGIEYSPEMLNWDSEEDHQRARTAFEKWKGFHEDAINSTSLKPRSASHKRKDKAPEEEDEEWKETYGEEAQKIIRNCVDANLADYEYLKSFAIKV